jgi:hypothetical protein
MYEDYTEVFEYDEYEAIETAEYIDSLVDEYTDYDINE